MVDLTRLSAEEKLALAARRQRNRLAGRPLDAEEPDDGSPVSGPGVAPGEAPAVAARAAEPKDRMNQTEGAYRDLLEARRRAGEIRRWDFEPEKLRLADRTYYTPDFRVVTAAGAIEFHEVKGRWMDDARVKIKVAAEQHPYRFVAVMKRRQKLGGGWTTEEIPGCRL